MRYWYDKESVTSITVYLPLSRSGWTAGLGHYRAQSRIPLQGHRALNQAALPNLS